MEVYIENYGDFVVINTDSNDLRQNLSDENKILLFYLSSDDIAIYDLNSRKTIETISFDKDISVYVENGVVVTEGKSYTVKNIISYWTLKNIDVPLWKHTLPEGFKIHGSVQAIDDVLFFIAYKDNHYQLVTGLDLETGEIIYQNQYEVTTANKFIAANAYNLTDTLFYGLGYIYQVFNPKTGEIVLEKSATECKSQEVEPYTNAVYNNKLWFVSGKYEEVKFGYLNIDTHEVEFTQDFPQEKDEIFEAPIYHNGSLYLRGKLYNNLYILE